MVIILYINPRLTLIAISETQKEKKEKKKKGICSLALWGALPVHQNN